MSNNQKNGRGYYIALVLCAVAIGICGYLYYRDADSEPQMQNPDTTQAAAYQPTDGVPVVATNPLDPVTQPTKPSESTQPTQAPEKKPLKTGSPLEGQTVAVYAMEELRYNQTTRDWRTHDGIDIAAEAGTKVCAAADGTVYTVYEDETMGMTVVIRHADGYTTKYASLSQEVSVAPGDEVVLGQAIGTVGSSALLESAIGDHVHFSVTQNDASVDPAAFFALG